MALEKEQEIRALFRHMRDYIVAHQEMGLDPPALSAEARDYLGAGTFGKPAAGEGIDQLNSLDALRSFIGDCTRCRLHKGRTRLVFGEGSPRARLVFVGEGPGEDEDLAGRPFVGKAGKKLTQIIENGMDLKRDNVFICNVVKCRPPGNRDPEADEIGACIPFLKKQLELIRPEVICTLGRIAGRALFGEDFAIMRERGKWRFFMDIPVMPTYHPAYILRNPSARRPVWEDVQEIMKRLGLEVRKNG
jgi:DNA polymerase